MLGKFLTAFIQLTHDSVFDYVKLKYSLNLPPLMKNYVHEQSVNRYECLDESVHPLYI